MQASIIRAVLCSAALLINPVQSAEPAAVPTLPTNNVGRVAQKFLAAINGEEPGTTDRFVEENIVEQPGGQMTREKYRSMLRKLHEQSGDLKLERVFMADDKNLRILIASPKNKKSVGLEIVLPEKESARASYLWIHHFPGRGPQPLPTESLGESAQVAAIEKFLEESHKLGLHSGAFLLAKRDRILIHKAWGYANSMTKTPNETRMQYGTASVGKMFTAVAIAQLQQQGKLDYNDTIERYFPDYPNKDAAKKVQIRHLLAHTAGTGDPFDSPKLANSKNYRSQSDYFETFADKPLAFEPGDHHEYSNGGFVVLAAIVEKVTGLSFHEYVRKNIFDVAGMRHSGKTTASEALAVAVPHAVNIVEDPLGLNGPQPKVATQAAEDGAGMGGWTSTTEDLFQFARALRTYKLLKESTTREITTGKVNFIPPPLDIKYCYGFYEMPIGRDRLIGHSGGGGDLGMGAEVEMLWNSEYTIVLLSNHDVEEARRAAHSVARFLVQQEEHRQTDGGAGN